MDLNPHVGAEVSRMGCQLRYSDPLIANQNYKNQWPSGQGIRSWLALSRVLRAQMSSRWCSVVVRRGGASSGVVHVT
ncbi:hypothetical protein TNCV_1846821 [Trichonephila clavipes]|nr:hypothetical protein TNCV_1846821 [Trichonephila clavipes]